MSKTEILLPEDEMPYQIQDLDFFMLSMGDFKRHITRERLAARICRD
jgi:hypothetical protein